MWGTSFADLAKKAQEQANSLSTIPSPVTGLFNLDGLQRSGHTEKDDDDDDNENEKVIGNEMNEESSNEKESIGNTNPNTEQNESDDSKKSIPDDENKDSETSQESPESSQSQTTTSDSVNSSHESKNVEEKPSQGEVDSMENNDNKGDLGNSTTSEQSHGQSDTVDAPAKEKDALLLNDKPTKINIDLKEAESDADDSISNENQRQIEQSIPTKENVTDEQQNDEQTQKNQNTEDSGEKTLPSAQSDASFKTNTAKDISETSSNSEQISEISKTENKIIDDYVVNDSSKLNKTNVTDDEKEHTESGDWTNVNVNSPSNSGSDEEVVLSHNDITPPTNELKQIDNKDGDLPPSSSTTDAEDSSPSSSAVLIENPFEKSFNQDENKNDDKNIPHEISHDTVDEDSNSKAEINQSDKSEEDVKPAASTVNEVPQYMIDKFMTQLQRLDENHQAEISQMEMKHQRELELITSNQEEDRILKLEQAEEKIKGLESLLREREDEKKTTDDTIFNLKREVERVEFKCAKFEKQIGNQVQSSEDNTLKLTQTINLLKTEIEEKDQLNKELQEALVISKEETVASQESFTALKTRVKSVATELKERRAECREFVERTATFESHISSLTSEKTKLTAELSEMKSMYEEKDDACRELQSEATKIKAELKNAQLKKEKENQRGDNALKSYKQKAQNALAEANSRAASANQAREEMMIEYEGAKQAASDVEKKLINAEQEKKEAERKAMEEITKLKKEIEDCETEISNMERKVEEAEMKMKEMEEDIGKSTSEQHKIFDEMEKMEEELEKEKENNAELHTKHIEEKQRAEQLMKEVLELRDVQNRTNTDAFMAKKKEQEVKQAGDDLEKKSKMPRSSTSNSLRIKEHGTDGTIDMLQDELNSANDAIAELKEALRDLSEGKKTAAQHGLLLSDSYESKEDDTGDIVTNEPGDKSKTANSDTPLFYALEKQAELSIAKDEINRLANLLGDMEAARMEALEDRNKMRIRMEEAEAKVKRQEKLGQSVVNPTDRRRSVNILQSPGHAGEGENVNLEYLKNVILQYLNATTLAQRKSLIPVVGAVLCLTQDEQRRAVSALESTSGLQSVGTSIIEGLETSLFGLSGTTGVRNNARREREKILERRRERRR